MISVATMQSWLGISGEASTLAIMEAGTISLLERETGRLLTSPAGVTVDIVDGGDYERGVLALSARAPSSPWVLLSEEPNGGTITSVEYRDSASSAWEAQTVGDFELDGRRLLFVGTGEPYPQGQRNVRVTYPFGYAEDAGPPDVTLVALEMIRFLHQRKAAGIIQSAGIGPMRITYAEFPTSIQMSIDAIRRPLAVM